MLDGHGMRLVSPSWQVYTVAGDSPEEKGASLNELASHLKIGWQLKGNLRQLCT